VEGELPRAFCSRGCWPRLRSKPPVAQFQLAREFDDSGLLAVLGRAAYTRKCPNTKQTCVGSAAAPNLFIKNIRAITPGASTAATP